MNWMRRHSRTIKFSLACAGLFFMLGFFYNYHLPRIEQWLLVEVEQLSETRSPVRIWPESLELRLFPIGLTLKNVRLLPQRNLTDYMTPTTVGEVELRLSLFDLLAGQIHFNRVTIANAEFDLRVAERLTRPLTQPHKQGRSRGTPALSFDRIGSWPISAIELKNVTIKAKFENPSVLLQIGSINLLLESRYRSIRGDLNSRDIQIQKIGDPAIYRADLATNFLFDEDGIYFSNIQLSRNKSFLTLAGAIEGNVIAGKIKKVHGEVRSDVNLDDVTRVLGEVLTVRGVPRLRGNAKFDGDFSFVPPRTPNTRAGEKIQAQFTLQTKAFGINQFTIGDAKFGGQLDQNHIVIRKSRMTGTFGYVNIPNAELAFNANNDFKLNLKSDRFDLQGLFQALGLRTIPVYIGLSADLPCTGHLKAPFALTCTGSVTGRNFRVNDSIKKGAHEIVRVNESAVQGSVTVTPAGVTYKSHLLLGAIKGQASAGDSSGTISFQNGFKIDYSSDRLQFSDIADLAGLKPEGVIAVKGTTQGDLNAATIDLIAHGDNMWLYDYKVGRARFEMRYRSGKLFFDHISGELNRSRYLGSLAIDLKHNQVKMHASVPFLDSADITGALSRKVTLPLKVSGTGTANLELWGPLKVNELSYDLVSNLFRGSIQDESFDQLTFDVGSRNGQVQTRNVNLVKGTGTLTLNGHMSPQGQVDLLAKGTGFALEQSDAFAKLKLNMTGNVSLQSHFTGPIKDPTVDAQGTLTQTTVGDQPADDSHFHFMMDPNEIDAGGDFLGSTLTGNWHAQRGPDGSSRLQFQISDWDFAEALAGFSDSTRLGMFQTALSGNADLSFPNKDWKQFTGRLEITKLDVQNGQTEMRALKKMVLIANNGILETHNFEITGNDQGYARLKSSSSRPGELAMSLDGNINMALLSLFTPFLDDLRGRGKFSFLIAGTVEEPLFSGAFGLEDGLIKLKGFPHAFERMSADISFNKNKISVNSVKGRLASGLLTASGHMSVTSSASGTIVPVDIKGNIKDARFNVPDGFHIRGGGDFYVKGNTFPYTIGANFIVDSGHIEPKQTASGKTVRDVKPSVYLPKFLSARRFMPIALALNVDVPKDVPIDLQISQMEIESSITGQLHINGDPQAPLLDGKVLVAKGGKVDFRSNTFDLSSASATYKQAPPDNPVLDVRGTTKLTAYLKNSETRDFDVDLTVQGKANNPKIILHSQPPLTQTDLISLLTLGFISETPEDFVQQQINVTDPNAQMANSGAQFGSAMLSQSLGISKKFEKKLGLQFDVSSSYDSVDQTTKPTITLRKQWTPRFGTTASREIGQTTVNDFSAEYLLNHNVSVLGSWEGRQYTTGTTDSLIEQENNDIFGLDLQYKKEFK